MAVEVASTRLALQVEKGAYLTDEKRLVQVRRVMRGGSLLVEECSSSCEEPTLTELTAPELAIQHWRAVVPEAGLA